MKTKNIKTVCFAVLGLLLTATGLVLLKTIHEPRGLMQTLPYLCVGIGCGVFGHNLGTIISKRTLKNHPSEAKKIEIEQKDERRLAISNKAKAKAYDMMIYVFGAMILVFALMQVHMIAMIILVVSYLFIIVTTVYYMAKYDKEM